MSSLVKQKRLSSKAIVSIAIAVISVLAIAVGALTIFALSQHTFNSSVKISYQAKDIAGKVTMYAKAAPKASNYTAKVDSEKIGEFEFTPTTDTTENPAEINMDDVELDSTDNALYLHYYFENTGTRAYTAVLNYALTDIITNQNMTLEYSENGSTYKNANSGLVVPGKGTKDYFVKISVTDLAFNADFEGMFTWQLNECDDSLTAMEEISLTATEFTVISEEDNTYSAKYNGQDISVGNVSVAGELSAQANTIENIWYVPALIGTGRVISVVQSGPDENGNQIYLPDKTKVVIANGVEILGAGVFSSCRGLTQIIIPNTVTTISAGSFVNCINLTEVTIPNSVTTLSGPTFASSGLTEITIPKSVTSIGSSVFYECTSLTKISISNSVTSIGMNAFGMCTGITEITIPNSVTSIHNDAFYGCSNLTTINFDANIEHFYFGDTFPSLYDATKQVTVNLGNNVTGIGYFAFQNCTGLKEITIPNSVIRIEACAFQGCSNLRSVKIPDSVTYMEYAAFQGCTSLSEVIIGNGLKHIAEGTFLGCTSLTEITIPQNVISLGNPAGMPFERCTNLTRIIFEDPNDWYSINYVDIEDDYGNYVSTETVYNEISAAELSDSSTAASMLVGSVDRGWIKEAE